MVADYKGYSHEELFGMVKAGQPRHVEDVATIWGNVSSTASELASGLARDLQLVTADWHGEAGAEFSRRIAAIIELSTAIAAASSNTAQRVAVMAQHLHEAQLKLEDPAATDDHDKAAEYAAKGAGYGSAAGPVGTVVGAVSGAVLGWNADEAEADKARARTVQLVEKLAAAYETHGTLGAVGTPLIPVGLPGGSHNAAVSGKAVEADRSAGYTAGTGGTAQVHSAHAPVPDLVHRPGDVHAGSSWAGALASTPTHAGAEFGWSDHPAEGASDEPESGTGLAGAGGGSFVSADRAYHGGAFTTSSGALRGFGMEGTAGMGFGGPGAGAGAVAGTGLAGSRSTGSSTGRTPAALPTQAPLPAPHAIASRPAGGQQDEQSAERLTWLTEDDMAWGAVDASPVVYGRYTDSDDPPGVIS